MVVGVVVVGMVEVVVVVGVIDVVVVVVGIVEVVFAWVFWRDAMWMKLKEYGWYCLTLLVEFWLQLIATLDEPERTMGGR